MKKLFALTLLAMLVFSMVVCVGATEAVAAEDTATETVVVEETATEYVYYENDFSDASTISDFTQYRGVWEIKDGALTLTGAGAHGATRQVFLLYTADDAIMNLTDYVLEVQVSANALAGILARCDTSFASADLETGFCGYRAVVNYTTSAGKSKEMFSFGRTNAAGGLLGDFGSKAPAAAERSSLRNVKVTVEGANISVVITDESGIELWNHSTVNDEWAMGTFGFGALPMDMDNSMTNIGLLKIDNLKVTAIGDVGKYLANGGKLADYVPTVKSNPVIVEKVPEDKVDLAKTEYVLYENDFSDPATLEDFTQALGNWVIQDGKLYMESNADMFSYLIYTADETGLVGKVSDYTIEADLTGAVTMAGIISYAETELFKGRLSDGSADANSFYGYLSFLSNNAGSGAIGASDATGVYGNVNGTVVAGPQKSGNYHLTVQHLDGKLTFTITDTDTNTDVYSKSATTDKWTTGSFGFRMRAENGGDSNLMVAAFDNLKVTVTGEEAALIHAGFAPNSEIVYNEVKLPANNTEETTAVTTAPVVDNGGGSISGVVIAAIAAGVVAIGAIVAIVVKKKATK